MKKMIYLDNGAGMQVSEKIAGKLKDFIVSSYGNPSSQHFLGEKAREEVDNVRKKLAEEIGAKPWEIIFTSGGTEANNLAILGIAAAYPKKKKIIISSIEHPSVYEVAEHLEERGYTIIKIPVSKEGFLDINKLESEIDENTLLVSIVHGQSEFGTLQDLNKIGKICKKKGTVFHTDAVQTFGKEKINIREMEISLLSASAHKIGGLKGCGFLFVGEGKDIKPIIFGGGQERGLRSGTENVLGIKSFELALEGMGRVDVKKERKKRDYFISALQRIGGKINGSMEKRLYNNANVSFSGIDAEMLVENLSQRGIMCSTRSACSSKSKKENKALKTLGLSEKEIKGTIRFVLSEKTEKEDIDYVIKTLKEYLSKKKAF